MLGKNVNLLKVKKMDNMKKLEKILMTTLEDKQEYKEKYEGALEEKRKADETSKEALERAKSAETELALMKRHVWVEWWYGGIKYFKQPQQNRDKWCVFRYTLLREDGTYTQAGVYNKGRDKIDFIDEEEKELHNRRSTAAHQGHVKVRSWGNFHEDQCSARKWEWDGGLGGYDIIQCSSCKKIPKEVALNVLLEFRDRMDEDQKKKLVDYTDGYDGCFCKNHLKQDFFMPNGWWLGKVNEARPEKPMLPKGSFKDGYQDDYKEHRWMYDAHGNNVVGVRKIIRKKKAN